MQTHKFENLKHQQKILLEQFKILYRYLLTILAANFRYSAGITIDQLREVNSSGFLLLHKPVTTAKLRT